ncbi:DUF2254 domain-containing protein [Pontibacter sp. 172403-2]|uniref:DUF2254 domain-containing protein n=1 Tax=Pontibacter rufus TaxID=2791028 RepID=UPI0018AFCB6F|nr:DUF2254 domain-containing protein [Pontibacter sp. 172403-2]MBF9255553.1 DUF2254 domain-containing protein [Pontibacter sp. 172403-2]
MKSILSRIKFVYQYIISSMGFYTTLVALSFFGLAFLMLYLERHGLSERLLHSMPFFIITNGASARLILSSITTGVISLTVFSFTMVMLVLNQASANFTPRVIPGLISYKSNQGVLGLYLGTLIYTLVVMVNIRSDAYSELLPGFSIFLAMCFTILCLAFFVYFIHSISQTIQIESILESIYQVTHNRLRKDIENDKGTDMPPLFSDNQDWHYLSSPRTGYLQSLDSDAALEVCAKHDIVLSFEQPLGSFVIRGIPFARINKLLPDSGGFTEELLEHINFYREERPEVNYLFGFKHITESAVKALSPGINDPGTAVKAIDYLTDLFALRMELTDEKVLYDRKGTGRIRFAHETFENVYALCLSPLRNYGKGSVIILLKLLYMLQCLLYKASQYPQFKPVLYEQAVLLVYDAGQQIHNPGDRRKINRMLQQLNKMNALDKPLPLLSLQQ